METQDLSVKSRAASGKSKSRALRRGGLFPAVVYGPKMAPEMVALDEREFDRKAGAGSHAQLFKLSSGDGSVAERLVLIKEVQRHPVSRNLLHADLYEVDVNEKILVDVALNFVGKAAGVDLGGILQPVRRSIEVLCLPLMIPDEIDIDVTALGVHDTIHISDLTPPEGVEFPYDSDIALVTVLPPVVEEARGAAGEAEAAGGAAAAEGEKAEGKESSEG
jgi:large subunit ribosomal protein L25